MEMGGRHAVRANIVGARLHWQTRPCFLTFCINTCWMQEHRFITPQQLRLKPGIEQLEVLAAMVDLLVNHTCWLPAVKDGH